MTPSPQPGSRKPSDPDADRRAAGEWYQLAGVGIEFAVSIVLFGLIGWWLDRWLGTLPWLLLVGMLLGFASGLWLLIRASRKMFKD